MSWSYSLTLTDDKDKVRLLIGDTDEGSQLVQDEEIIFFLTEEGGVYGAAAAACRKIAADFTRKVSIVSKESGIKDDMKEKADGFLKLAEEYESRSGRSGLTVFAGGISQADKDERAADSDTTAPAFRKDLHQSSAISDLPGALTNS